MKYLFVGEKRSDLAVTKGWTWVDGRLAAKQLFDALIKLDINPHEQEYINWFEWLDIECRIKFYTNRDYVVVGMGKKVQKELMENNIPFIPITHPAARGKIRGKNNYCQHLKEALNHETAV